MYLKQKKKKMKERKKEREREKEGPKMCSDGLGSFSAGGAVAEQRGGRFTPECDRRFPLGAA